MSRFLPLFALTAALVHAQTGLATLTGTITDPSGAVMANVPISAKHVSTGTLLSAATSSTGNYTITNLPIGEYEVVIEQAGFKRYVRDGVALASQQVLRIDATLEVGSTGDSITVTAEATLMKTDSGQVVHNVTMREIQTLPLIPVTDRFRDPFAVVQLLPGVQRYVTQSQMVINGLPNGSVQFRIEGQVMGNARQGFQPITGQVQPSVDAVEQVAVQTSNFSAEFGSVAGALFSVTMRSGTNQFHGSVFDYAANEVLNSYDPAVHLRDRVRRHDWGFTFGGPIKIPKVYDGKNKTFFFWNWERYFQNLVTVANANSPTVPIQAYRDGDFSRLTALSGNRNLTIGTGAAARDYKDPLGGTILAGTLFDPRSTRQVTCSTALSADCGANGALLDFRTPFPGNRVPLTLFDPVATAIQTKYIPLPAGPRAANNEVINNFQVPVNSRRLSIIPSIKIDHNLSTNARINGYWQWTQSTAPVQAIGGAEGFPDPITSNRGTYQTSNSLRVNYDHTLRPTLQFHLGLAYSKFDWADKAIITDYNPATDIGWRGATLVRNFPRFGANLGTSAGVGIGGMSAMGPSPQGTNPERRPAVNLTMTWTRGNHTAKFGAEWRQDVLPTGTFTNTAGTFGALGNGITWQPSLLGVTLSGATNVGFPYAEYLMGSVRGFTLSVPINYRISKHQWGAYVQDSWRVSRNLTVGYGLRWDYGTYTKEDYGRNGALSLTEPNPSASGRPGAIIYEATCKCTFAQNYPLAIGPRTDFAYTLNPKTVIRGGFGVAYGSTDTFGGSAQNSATTANLIDGQDAFKMRDGVPSSIRPEWPVYNPALGHLPGTVQATVPTLLDPNAGRPSRTYQWNLSLQREITRDLVIEASYVGNRGIWQSAAGLISHNAVSPELLTRYGFRVGDLNDATLLNKTLANLTTAERSTLQARGVSTPYPNFPTNQTLFQSLRPFPQYNGAIASTSAPLGRSWYDALQVAANKRYSRGLQFNANFTWSKNLQSRGIQDVFNRSFGNKDVDTNNLPWQVRIAVDYQLAKPGADIPVLGNRWIATAIGGWGIATSLTYQPGPYLGRPANGATNAISRWLQRGPGGAQLKKTSDGSYMSPWAVNWTGYDGKVHAEPLDVNCHCFDPEKTIVFNPAAWEAVPDGVWARDVQQLQSYRGPRRPQENANLSRNFKFGPEGKFGLQIRVEMQNILNRSLLPNSVAGTLPQGSGLNFNAAPTLTADGRYTSGFGTFGNLRAAGAFGPQRSGIFVGRFTF